MVLTKKNARYEVSEFRVVWDRDCSCVCMMFKWRFEECEGWKYDSLYLKVFYDKY
jgi:hypothetical protein